MFFLFCIPCSRQNMGIPFDIPGFWERVYSAGQSASTDFAKKVMVWRGYSLRGKEKRSKLPYCQLLDINVVYFCPPRDDKWRGWDSNPQPMAYESTAPPLSYLAICVMMLTESAKKVNYFMAVPYLLFYLLLHGPLRIGWTLSRPARKSKMF